MIVYACIIRSTDGLPLSATNDFSKVSEQKVQDGKRLVKLISKKKFLGCKKICLQADQLTVHCLHNDCASYMAVCDPGYAHILAYSFLDELRKEFSMLYIPSVVASVKRPFGFIEFESYLQKVQTKYNNVRSLTSHLSNLPEMTEDLNLNPPKYIKLPDIEPPLTPTPKLSPSPSFSAISIATSNGVPGINGSVCQKDEIKLNLKPISWYGRIAMILTIFCVLLDAYRGFNTLVFTDGPDGGGPSASHAFAFIFESIAMWLQVYYLRNYSKHRKPISLFSFGVIVLLNFALADVRETVVTIGYIVVSFLLLLATKRRNFEKRLPDHCI